MPPAPPPGVTVTPDPVANPNMTFYYISAAAIADVTTYLNGLGAGFDVSRIALDAFGAYTATITQIIPNGIQVV